MAYKSWFIFDAFLSCTIRKLMFIYRVSSQKSFYCFCSTHFVTKTKFSACFFTKLGLRLWKISGIQILYIKNIYVFAIEDRKWHMYWCCMTMKVVPIWTKRKRKQRLRRWNYLKKLHEIIFQYSLLLFESILVIFQAASVSLKNHSFSYGFVLLK